VALHIQDEERKAGNTEFWGFVFQGDAYEGLSCNALEWIDSYGGGTLLDSDGKITVNNSEAVVAIARAASWIGTSAPARVLSFHEEDSRIFFELGNAAFMRNWPYAWALLNAADSPIAGKVEVSPLPKGGFRGKSSGTLGGWQLAVSKFSKHPEAAADLVRFLTSAAVQKQRALAGSYAPTIMSLYDDPEILNANPFFAKLRPMLENAVARPSAAAGEKYMAVSTRFWEAVHDVLQGRTPAAESIAALEDRLKLIHAGGGW
jgi:trehalose/maltose transport system substrate-binding protein